MAEALPQAEIVHTLPGRTRLRIAARRGQGTFFAAVATGLLSLPGVSQVNIRPLTGSILIEHGQTLEEICEGAEKSRLFVLADAPWAPPDKSAVFARLLAIDPRMAVAAGLGLLALWQVRKGTILPQAATLAWYAAELAGVLPKPPRTRA